MNLVQTLFFFFCFLSASPVFPWIQDLCWQQRRVDAGEAPVLPAHTHQSLTCKPQPALRMSPFLTWSQQSWNLLAWLSPDYHLHSDISCFKKIFSAKARLWNLFSTCFLLLWQNLFSCVNKKFGCFTRVRASFQSGSFALWLQSKTMWWREIF